MHFTTIVALSLLGFALAQDEEPTSCLLDNEEYTDCGTSCPRTCQQNSGGPCSDLCVKGCFCREGFVRRSVGGQCVPLDACASVPQCKENQEFKLACACLPACQKFVCEPYPQACYEQCVCKKGFILNVRGGQCITEASCLNDTS